MCGALMRVYPKQGIRIGHAEIRFPTWLDFWQEDTVTKVDMDAILRAGHMSRLDSLQRYREAQALEEEERRAREREEERIRQMLAATKLQFAEDSKRLSLFQAQIDRLRSSGEQLRILHFGDSQIEGDRISSYLREKFQARLGGEGPGMIAPVPLAPTFSVQQSHSPNWKRYTRYGRQDTSIQHQRFGYLATFGQYGAITDSLASDSTQSDTLKAWLEFQPSRQAYRHARRFEQVKLFFGHHKTPLQLEIWANDTLYKRERIAASDSMLIRSWYFPEQADKLRLTFSGLTSTEVYGISLQGSTGVSFDNIPMRGASGTIFRKLDPKQLGRMLRHEPVGLVLLQYGGNTVPYIRDAEHARQYAGRLRYQIRYLRRLLPQASFVLIGPSDMSEKEGTEFVSYEAVSWVRNALRDMALEEGIGFWDIYGAMGGRNSMPSWVSNDPPLAGPDHIHFTPKGARQVAIWLNEAFEEVLFPQDSVNAQIN